MKTAFITGANKGIGVETARQLAALGYHVFIGSRNRANGDEAIAALKGLGLENVDMIEIDVTDSNSIQSARQALGSRIAVLDVLVNNAGIRGEVPQPATKVPMATLRNVFETNFFGAVQTTQAFIDLMRKSEQPRIVNVTSDLSSLTDHSDPAWKYYPFKSAAYGPSKTALNAYTVMLAFELKDTKFKVNCVNPGHTATDFNNQRGEQTVEQGARVIVEFATLGAEGPSGKFLGKDGVIAW
jgi:NAD(P)-dependent dehydrogenase (short-subunit alcohol dehydrogenase family)